MRPSILNPLFVSADALSGVGQKYYKLLANLSISKMIDFIWQMPHNVIDRTYAPKIATAQIGRVATIKVKVIAHQPNTKKSAPYKVICEDDTDQITLSFFKAYPNTIQKNLPVGAHKIISGKIDIFNGDKQMNHPDVIVNADEEKKAYRIEPVYSLTAGITNRTLGYWIYQAMQKMPKLEEWQDKYFIKEKNLPTFSDAIYGLHFPKSAADILPSSKFRTRLAYDELLANQLSLGIARNTVKKQKGRVVKGNGLLRKKALEQLGFELTDAQKRVLTEISTDMQNDYRMLRLLQGDVGSGKTIVALLSMLNAVECGFQASIMAPTEILATQHFETIKEICDEIGVNVTILTGRIKGKAREKVLKEMIEGKADIIIGTHALFQEGVEFKDLAFVVVDEQHRFGVHQRLMFSSKGEKTDVLVMTATPIPRTLVLTSFGDMEYSKIDELPKGRKPVDTRIIPLSKTPEIIERLRQKINEGEQVYWVCPLIEENEKLDLAAAVERFETLQKHFGDCVGLVHGKMKDKEKNDIMTRFKNGELKVLVATTVIEVGVNVPSATLMIIENAQRFGLAQLHQLRGRIKRGSKAGTCLLLYSYPLSEVSKSRLEIMKKTEDGFEISEKDLELRGGGEMLGVKQSGFQEFKIADVDFHKDLLLVAYKDAKMILETDPKLETQRGQNLRNLLYLFEKDKTIKTFNA
ncbi:MAG: ATP-dependent DNA helicase RecG [Alphaproteobacteria bacterium]